jgi:hypothetical protein
MLTTLKSGSTVLVSGLPVNVCTDVEVEIDETHLANLSEEDANLLGIPCTRRHHHPPDISQVGLEDHGQGDSAGGHLSA